MIFFVKWGENNVKGVFAKVKIGSKKIVLQEDDYDYFYDDNYDHSGHVFV